MKRLLIVFSVASAAVCHAEEPAAGRWEGSIQIPGRELRLIVDLSADGTGAWSGSATIPGLNLKGAALSDIALNASELTFALKSVLKGQGIEPPTFKTRFAGDGKMSGEFLQAGNIAPFTLEKTGPAQVDVPRQSTPIAKEFEGEWRGQYEMFGYSRNVTLKLANRPAKGASAELVIVGKKVNNLPVDLVTQESDLLTIDSRETGFSYEGRLWKDEIRGALLQGPLEHPLVLKRAR